MAEFLTIWLPTTFSFPFFLLPVDSRSVDRRFIGIFKASRAPPTPKKCVKSAVVEFFALFFQKKGSSSLWVTSDLECRYPLQVWTFLADFRPPNPLPLHAKGVHAQANKKDFEDGDMTWGLATQLTIPDSLATGSERLDTIYHHATITRGDLLPFQVSWGSREGRLNRPGRLDEMPAFLDDQVTTVHCISCSLSIVPCLLFGMNAYWHISIF